MTKGLECTQQSKREPITHSWKLTVADRRLMWLQKCHPERRATNFSSGHQVLKDNRLVRQERTGGLQDGSSFQNPTIRAGHRANSASSAASAGFRYIKMRPALIVQ